MKQKTFEHYIDPAYAGLYRTAGVGLLIATLFVLVDMGMSFGGGDVPTGTWSAVEWFEQFNQNGFLGLRNLGLFNVINLTLTIPLYTALYQLHRRGAPVLAMLALVLYLLGAAVYVSNNRALAMLSLSEQYASAVAGTERDLIAAAGTAILAQAEDFTPGTFTGFFFSSMGSLMMMAAMLRGRVFGRGVSLMGLVGSGALLIFTIAITFAPATFDLMMPLAMVGGLLMLGWNVVMAVRMFQLSRAESLDLVTSPAPVMQ